MTAKQFSERCAAERRRALSQAGLSGFGNSKTPEIIGRETSHFGHVSALKPVQLTTVCRLTLRALSGVGGGKGDALKIVGCPVPYERLSCDLGGFREVYQRGCFAASLSSDLRVLFNHDTSRVMGRTTAGTALFYEQSDGLYCECEPPDNASGNDLVVSVDRGDITGMSANFVIRQQRWEYRSGERIRVVERGDLVEASIVPWPAYEATYAAVSKPKDQSLAAGSFYPAHAQKGIQ